MAFDVHGVVAGIGLAELEEQVGDGGGPAEEAVQLGGREDGDGGRVLGEQLVEV